MKVTVGGKALTAGKDYKVTTEAGKFHILFAPTADNSSDIIAAKATFPVGAPVLVTYTMTVNKNAHVDGVDTNTSEVEYSHNPNIVTDHQKTPGDTNYVYVGKFTLTKTDTNNAPLAGAVFHIKDAKSNIVVTAVDEYGNRTSITTPDNVNHDMLGRPLEFASHPVLMRNVRRWMVWLLQAQYCKDYKWDTNRLGGWMEVLGLPADLDIPVTEEHLRVLKPVFNTG